MILIANRDEFYERPTAAAAHWKDHPHVFGGRDLVAKGTWLGVTDSGRFAAVTNYRQKGDVKGSLSRGDLAADFLKTNTPASEYLDKLAVHADDFSGFNLLVGEVNDDRSELFYFSNRNGSPRKLAEGIYGLSNHLLDTPWPKVRRGKERFSTIVKSEELDLPAMFDLLQDRTVADDSELPDTGVGLKIERALSPIFIETPIYGTRCSSVLTIDKDLRPVLDERVHV